MPRTCKLCGNSKPLEAFQYSEQSGRYSQACHNCRGSRLNDINRKRAWRYKNPLNFVSHILSVAKAQKTREVYITPEEVVALYEKQGGICAVTGEKMTVDQDTPYSNISIDRIDCSKPYLLENIRLVCSKVNIMRGRMSDEELKHWASLIVKGLSRGT